MTPEKKAELTKNIIKNSELFALQGSRLKRLLKDPIRSIPAYFMQAVAYVKPYKVGYTTLWGDKMHFYLPEAFAIYYYGFFEANLTNFFINFFKAGDIFLDVGAHVGYYSVLVSALVGETGAVHSFEPTPRTFQTLSQNAAIRKNITINNNAVMDTETEIEFSDYGPKYSAFNSFKIRTGDESNFLSTPNIVKVKTVSLDRYCNQNKIKPTLIKIDAEGAEHIILKAMDSILKNDKPVITIEVAGGEEWIENCKESIALLESHGYKGYEITTEGYLHPHIPKNTYAYDNLVFIFGEKVKELEHLLIKQI